LWAHILAGALTVAAILIIAWGRPAWRRFRHATAAAAALLVLLPAGTALHHRAFPPEHDRIRNPLTAPASMYEEGGGPNSPFFPSSSRTNVGGIIPSNFFMDSESCAECHRDIYEQWKGSMHHFASFNNQFYRKSVEYMQEVAGVQASKWCAGCHDHAVFFNGRFEKPIKDQIDTPEAHAGLACTSCHAITHVDSSMGNGGFTIQYPPLHELATSKNKWIRGLERFFTYIDPAPHRATFMKPFMRLDASEFCSSCHKVHLDVPVNDYRWIRGFNDYDNWQASGVSGQGARSFYYPEKPSTCVDCHMPLAPSKDYGTHSGMVHSHRFPGANTAVAYVNKDAAQFKAEEEFLKSGFITVDIFAASPVDEPAEGVPMIRRAGANPQAFSFNVVGEEAEQGGAYVIRNVGEVAAPLDRSDVAFRPGSTVRMDVVVRTRKIGHAFPGGTFDSFDVWLELQGRDANGRVIFWSGRVEDDGKGPVEPGAHFYRAYLLDAEGNPINKRNAWQARSVLYVRAIPPGAADVAHYRVRIPEDAVGPLTFTARLNYRKFSHYYTQFSYAGQPAPGQDQSLIGKGHNSLEYTFLPANIPPNVSGQIKDHIPQLPIIELAFDETQVALGPRSASPKWQTNVDLRDRERWNDWGIGMLLQGDLKGADYAFHKVIEAEPAYSDGWLNVARAMIQEGETSAAKKYVSKALELAPEAGRNWFFQAMIQKADGDYPAALESLRKVESMFPRDRVALNQMARILFLERRYEEALRVLERVCAIDPEDLQMHYTMMLCYRGLGDEEKARREQKLFERFKADEASQAITAQRRMASPEDNNERQMIHEHESVPLERAR
jgi:tetratricopeptide (TPR) repeat protein